MKVCVVLCVLYTLVAARPSSFESDLIVTDGEGFFRSGHARRDARDALEYNIRFHKNVILLDRQHHIESIKCHSGGNLIIEVQPESKIDSWNAESILYGGKEWNCRGENGKAARFAVRPITVTRSENKVFVQGQIVQPEQVFETLQLSWLPSDNLSNKRQEKIAQWNKTLAWNVDQTKMEAAEQIPIFKLDCKSAAIKKIPNLSKICTVGDIVHVSAICSDCWALYKMNIVFQYDQNGKKQLTTTGILRVSVIVDMKSTAIFSYNVTDAFKMSTSLVTLGVPGVADVTFDFGVAIDMNVNWNVIGTASTGALLDGDFSVSVGSGGHDNKFNLKPQVMKPKGQTYGKADVETIIRAGPHFKVHLLTQNFFDAYTEVAPALRFNIDFKLSGFPAKTTPDPTTIVKQPWMTEACVKRHMSEWQMTLGALVNVGASGPLIPQAWSSKRIQNQWNLASGCLVPMNFTRSI